MPCDEAVIDLFSYGTKLFSKFHAKRFTQALFKFFDVAE